MKTPAIRMCRRAATPPAPTSVSQMSAASGLRLSLLPLALIAAWPVAAQTEQGTAVLPAITITANRVAQDLQSAPLAASVITGAQILASGATDANDAIRKLLGIPSRTDLTGGRDYSLDLRGFGATADQNVVVVVDGIRISENELATARLSAIAPEMIESIEVVRGGSSVQWGEGASAGVINVVLKQSAPKGVSGAVVGQLESFAGRDLRANVRVGAESATFDANVRSYASNGYRDNNAVRQDSASVGLNVNSGPVSLRLRVGNENQNSRLPGALTFAQFQANPRQAVNPYDSGSYGETRVTAGAQYKSGPWTWALDLGARSRDVGSDTVSFNYVSKTKSDSTQVSPRVTYSSTLGASAITVLAGADRQRWGYSVNSASPFGSQNELAFQFNDAWYLSADLKLPTDTRLVAGVRQEQVTKRADDAANFVSYNRPDSLDAWDLGLNQALFKGFNAYVRTAKAYRLPNVDENRYLTAALRPQNTRDVEVGVKWQNNVGQSANLRYFEQNATDEIAFNPLDPACAPFGGCNANLDPTRRTGVEFEGRTPVGKALTLSGSLQTVNARFSQGTNAGSEIPLVSSVAGALRLNWAIDAVQTLALGVQYLGSARFGDDNANTCSGRIPTSTLLDARYGWKMRNIEWSVAAANLTDVKSYSQAFNCANGAGGGIYPDPGRTLKAAVKYNF